MAVLTPREALEVCYEAGFRYGKGIVIMPAIGWAESRLRTDARGINYKKNPDGSFVLVNGQKVVDSTDRGWLQINDKWHPSMTDEMCDDPLTAAKYAFKISEGGTKFSLWSTFNSGAYLGPERMTYATFMAEWSAKAERLKLAEANAELVGVQAANTQLQRVLAETTAALNETNEELTKQTTALRDATSTIETLTARLTTTEREYFECQRIAFARQVRLDAVRAALDG